MFIFHVTVRFFNLQKQKWKRTKTKLKKYMNNMVSCISTYIFFLLGGCFVFIVCNFSVTSQFNSSWRHFSVLRCQRVCNFATCYIYTNTYLGIAMKCCCWCSIIIIFSHAVAVCECGWWSYSILCIDIEYSTLCFMRCHLKQMLLLPAIAFMWCL